LSGLKQKFIDTATLLKWYVCQHGQSSHNSLEISVSGCSDW